MKKFFLMLLLIIGEMIFALPAKAISPPTQENESCKYTITYGDWLSKLAGQHLGDPLNYPAITYYTNEMAFNDSSFDTIFNSDAITVGQKVCLPSVEKATVYFEKREAIVNNKNNTFGVITSLEAIDPFTDTNHTADDFVEPLLFDTLITLNEDGMAQPALAESWDLTGDNPTVVTLNLRKRVFYHNNDPTKDDQPFDADHLTAFWNQLPFPTQDFGCPTATAIDTYTVQLTCHDLDAAEIIFGLSQIWIVHPDYFINKEKALFGTGRWQVYYSGQNNGEPITLIKNPTYWGVAEADSAEWNSAEWNFQLITDPADPGWQGLDRQPVIIDFDPGLIGIGDGLNIHTIGDWNTIGCSYCAISGPGGHQGGTNPNPGTGGPGGHQGGTNPNPGTGGPGQPRRWWPGRHR